MYCPPSRCTESCEPGGASSKDPHQLAAVVGLPRSTIYGVLRRHRMSRLVHLDRPTGAPIRYERDHPGELVHIDLKNLGRIPLGGGRRCASEAPRSAVPSA